MKSDLDQIKNKMSDSLKEWAEGHSLEETTLSKLKEEGFISLYLIKLMSPKQVKAFKLNMGQTLALENAVKSLSPKASDNDSDSEESAGASASAHTPAAHDAPVEHDLAALMEACKKAVFYRRSPRIAPQVRKSPFLCRISSQI